MPAAVALRDRGHPWFMTACTAVCALGAGAGAARYGFGTALIVCLAGAGAIVFVAAAARPALAASLLLGAIGVFPVARLVAFSIPIYATDVLVFVGLIALGASRFRAGRYGELTLVYVLTWLPAYAYQVATLGLIAAPTYGLIRNVLAVLAFFVGRRMLVDWSRTLTLGVLATATFITSTIAVLQEFNPTYAAMRSFLTRLAPAFMPAAYDVYPHRASALLESPPAVAAFLAMLRLS